MKIKWLRNSWLWHLIGPVIVVVAVYLAGPVKVWAVLSEGDLRFIAGAVILAIPMVLIKGIRWFVLLDSYDIKLPFAESTGIYAAGMLFSAITPGRVGDLVKIAILIKKGYSAAKAIACNILDRLFDVATVLLAGTAGMWYFSAQFASHLRIINIVGAALLALLVLWVAKRHSVKKIATKLIPNRYHSVAGESWNEIAGGFGRDRIGHKLLIAVCTVLFWAIYFSAIYLCGLAVGVNVSFFYVSACAAVAMLLSMLPITVAGVGTRDAVFVLLLGQIGIEKHQSLAFSTLVLGLFLINCIIFYIVSIAFRPKKTSPN
jgi:uncharacterized protein (TIRG00374 family)